MFSTLVAISIVLLQVCTVMLIVCLVANINDITTWVARNASILIRVLFVGSALGSLIYEYGFNYPPCLLCWYQRIAIFGIAILVFTADIRKSALLKTQVLLLASLGFAVALFHNYLDIFQPTGVDVCGATGVSCLARYVYEFGYITIPMMSATILLVGIVIALCTKKHSEGYPQAVIAE